MKHAATDRPTTGLTPARLRVLEAIVRAGDGANLSEIAATFNVKPQAVQKEAAWLLEREFLRIDRSVKVGRYYANQSHPTVDRILRDIVSEVVNRL